MIREAAIRKQLRHEADKLDRLLISTDKMIRQVEMDRAKLKLRTKIEKTKRH